MAYDKTGLDTMEDRAQDETSSVQYILFMEVGSKNKSYK